MTSDLQIPFPTQPGLGLPFRWKRKGNLDQGTRKLDRRHTLQATVSGMGPPHFHAP